MLESYLKKRKKSFFRSRASAPAGSLTPAQVCEAYQCAKVEPVRVVKIGVVTLGGYYSNADTVQSFTTYGLHAPTVVTQGTQDPTDSDSTVENMLDIECAGAAYAYSTGQAAQIVEDFQPNQSGAIAASINALVAAGCEVITCSWGGPYSQTPASERAATAAAIANAQAQGVHFFAASGDNSLDDGTNSRTPDHPSCDVNAWAVGGTQLILNTDGSIESESAWGDGDAADEGGGGGFVPGSTQPSWQVGVVPGKLMGKPDSSANADPASGYQIVAVGQWQVVGGTSASTPLTAGYVAAILSTLPGRISGTQLQTLLYGNYKTAFRDIVLGSNGDPAVSGWDDATGLGSINGPGMLAALTGAVVAPPIQPPPPPPVPTPPSGPSEAFVQGAVDSLFAHSRLVSKQAIDHAIQWAFAHGSSSHFGHGPGRGPGRGHGPWPGNPWGPPVWTWPWPPTIPVPVPVPVPAPTAPVAMHAEARIGGNLLMVLAQIEAWVQKYGSAALPYIEALIAQTPLTPSEKAAIVEVLNLLLGGAAAAA